MSKFEKYFVIGTGSVALACADTLMGLNLNPTLIESRKSGLSSLRASCDKKGIVYLSLQGGDLKVFLSALEESSLIVSAANRYLFPAEVVAKPNLTIINYHGALLPKHPGRNAEAWAIYEGDKEAGITWHFVSSGIDTGAIIDQRSVPISDKTTSMLLLKQYGQLAVASFNDFVGDLLNNNISSRKQTEQHPLHLSSHKPNDGFLDLNWSGEQMSRFLRSMDYGPLQTLGIPQVVFFGDTYLIEKYEIQSKEGLSEMRRFNPETDVMTLQKDSLEIIMQLKKV